MRGPVGLVIGLVVGAGAMYLVLRPPWAGGPAAVAVDAGVVATTGSGDAGVKLKKKKVRRPAGSPGAVAGGSDEWIDEGPELVQVSGADLAIKSRGAAQLPPGKIDMSSGTEARSLSSEEINFVVSTQTGAVRDCVVRGATNTSIHGVTITITMAVDGTGRVTAHRLEAPAYMLERGLYDCTTRAVARMKFPATGAGTLVDFPVTLN